MLSMSGTNEDLGLRDLVEGFKSGKRESNASTASTDSNSNSKPYSGDNSTSGSCSDSPIVLTPASVSQIPHQVIKPISLILPSSIPSISFTQEQNEEFLYDKKSAKKIARNQLQKLAETICKEINTIDTEKALKEKLITKKQAKAYGIIQRALQSVTKDGQPLISDETIISDFVLSFRHVQAETAEVLSWLPRGYEQQSSSIKSAKQNNVNKIRKILHYDGDLCETMYQSCRKIGNYNALVDQSRPFVPNDALHVKMIYNQDGSISKHLVSILGESATRHKTKECDFSGAEVIIPECYGTDHVFTGDKLRAVINFYLSKGVASVTLYFGRYDNISIPPSERTALGKELMNRWMLDENNKWLTREEYREGKWDSDQTVNGDCLDSSFVVKDHRIKIMHRHALKSSPDYVDAERIFSNMQTDSDILESLKRDAGFYVARQLEQLEITNRKNGGTSPHGDQVEPNVSFITTLKPPKPFIDANVELQRVRAEKRAQDLILQQREAELKRKDEEMQKMTAFHEKLLSTVNEKFNEQNKLLFGLFQQLSSNNSNNNSSQSTVNLSTTVGGSPVLSSLSNSDGERRDSVSIATNSNSLFNQSSPMTPTRRIDGKPSSAPSSPEKKMPIDSSTQMQTPKKVRSLSFGGSGNK